MGWSLVLGGPSLLPIIVIRPWLHQEEDTRSTWVQHLDGPGSGYGIEAEFSGVVLNVARTSFLIGCRVLPSNRMQPIYSPILVRSIPFPSSLTRPFPPLLPLPKRGRAYPKLRWDGRIEGGKKRERSGKQSSLMDRRIEFREGTKNIGEWTKKKKRFLSFPFFRKWRMAKLAPLFSSLPSSLLSQCSSGDDWGLKNGKEKGE